MARPHTPEELAEAKRILKEATPLFEQRKITEQAERERWSHEIAMLERRVRDEYVEIDLGGGDTLAIRTALSEVESIKLGELYKQWFTPMKKPDKNAVTAKKKVSYEIIALVTANPLITRDWLEQNPDRFSTDDAVHAIISYAEERQKRENDRARGLIETLTFRPLQAGAELRGVSPSPPDSGPEGMGGSP